MFTSQRFNPTKKTFTKSNYVNALELITPKLYFEEDANVSGNGRDLIYEIVDSHVQIANVFSSVIFVSSLPNTTYSSINSISGILPFFIKQNNLTEITLDSFEHDILIPLGRSFREFDTSAEFAEYLPQFLSSIRLNYPTATFTTNTAASASHKYLLDNLGWMYILNTSGNGGLAFQPSSYVSSLLVDKLYRDQAILTNDGIKGLTEYIWKNYEACSTWRGYNLIPNDYLPSAFLTASSNYTSGTQQLDKLKTLIDVAYSPLQADSTDYLVRDRFNWFLSGNSSYLEKSRGPFLRLLRAFSFSFADVNNEIDSLGLLYDLEQCPDHLLPELANLIGWKLFGSDANRWRLQLLNAVGIYKRTGTLESIQAAVDSLFTKDVFDVSSNIYELWESYIPFLMEYALATESSYFANFSTWTPNLAREMNVSGYSVSSMQDNIKMVVDSILLELVTLFPENFLIGKTVFPLNSSSFSFNYRGRKMPIPPYEEIPYYANTMLTERMILKIVDKLACFGVRKEFALQLGDYIKTNTVRAYDDLRVGNSFLMFTSGIEFPPNWNSVLANLSQNREEILSLWNGKSSHYKLILEASSFDFAKDTLEVDSRNAIYEASRIANSFAPAHAIQDTRLFASVTDYYNKYNAYLPFVDYGIADNFLLSMTGPVNKEFYGHSAVTRYFGRGEVDSVLDDTIGPTSGSIIAVGRNAWRRRNFKNTLPLIGFYYRSGFNAPLGMYPSSTEYSYISSLGYLPLGYIPSAGKFMPIAQYSAIPSVYSYCENLRSSSTFSGVATSATFPCRGSYSLGSLRQFTRDDVTLTSNVVSSDYYVDRGQLSKVVYTMHWLKEEQKKKISEFQVLNSSSLYRDNDWLNVSASLANSATTSFPTSYDDYINFSFGKRIHDLYKDYTDYLGKHYTRPAILDVHGNTIFGYAYGSIFPNSEFKNLEQVLTQFPTYYASSTTVASSFNNNNYFNSVGIGSGPLIVDSTLDVVVSGYTNPTKEYIGRNILENMYLIQTSGASDDNSFTIFNLDQAYSVADNDEANYVINNPLIKIKAVDGLPRIKLAHKSYADGDATTPSGFALIPDHKYQFNIKALACNEQGTRLGGARLGIWVHTKPENGLLWSWNPNSLSWQMNKLNDFTYSYLLKNLTAQYNFDEVERKFETVSSINPYRCIETIKDRNAKDNFDVIRSFVEKDFTTLTLEFDTINRNILALDQYYKQFGQVHRIDSRYVIEIFMIPDSSKDKFVLLDNINFYSITENNRLNYIASGYDTGVPFGEYCGETYVKIPKQHLLNILNYFNYLTGDSTNYSYGPASRIGLRTSDGVSYTAVTNLETSGGSRLNYRIHPDYQSQDNETIFGTYKEFSIAN
jgi:hypothetical protein